MLSSYKFIFGEKIIAFLYDERYWQAGWMLRVLSVGIIGSMVTVTSDRVMLALGDSLSYFILQVIRSSLLILCVSVGTIERGFDGFLIGLSSARLLAYVPLAPFLWRRGVWLPKLDFTVLIASAGVIGIGIWAVGS